MADKYIKETIQYCDQILNDRSFTPTVREINLIERLKAIIQVHQHQKSEVQEICKIMQSLMMIQAGPADIARLRKDKHSRAETDKQ